MVGKNLIARTALLFLVGSESNITRYARIDAYRGNAENVMGQKFVLMPSSSTHARNATISSVRLPTVHCKEINLQVLDRCETTWQPVTLTTPKP